MLLALLDDDIAVLDGIMSDLQRVHASATERVPRFVRAMLERGEDAARLQVRADLWAAISSDPAVRTQFAEAVRRGRLVVRTWIEEAIAAGELVEIPANALAAILLALGDGLMVHAGLDPAGFRWTNVGTALDGLLEGVRQR